VRVNCVHALIRQGNEGIDALIKALPGLKAEDVQINALQTLVYGPHRPKAIPLLLECLKGKSTSLRLSCVHMVQNIGGLKEATPFLVAFLEHDDDNLRQSSAYALGNNAEGQKALEGALLKAKKSPTRLAILHSYTNFGIQSKGSVPGLITCLKDKNAQVRWLSCMVLANIGPPAKEAAPILQDLLKDSDKNVRVHAQNALSRMGVEPKKVEKDK
jgi:HEAT repeat protein